MNKSNSDKPLVSVICPVYKAEQYLPECFDSILNQTYINIEVILVDDGQPEGSGEICDEYAKKDSRIRVLHKENEGQNYARRDGVEIANGDIIAFIDCDDFYELDWLEIGVSTMIDEKADLIIAAPRYYYENTPKLAKRDDLNIKDIRKDVIEGVDKNLDLYSSMLYCGPHYYQGTLWDKLFSKNLLSNINWDYNKNFYEDFTCSLQLFQYVNRAVQLHIPVLNFRVRAESQSHNVNEYNLGGDGFFDKLRTFYACVDSIIDELDNKGIFIRDFAYYHRFDEGKTHLNDAIKRQVSYKILKEFKREFIDPYLSYSTFAHKNDKKVKLYASALKVGLMPYILLVKLVNKLK